METFHIATQYDISKIKSEQTLTVHPIGADIVTALGDVIRWWVLLLTLNVCMNSNLHMIIFCLIFIQV